MKLPSEQLKKIWICSDLHGFHVNLCRGTTSWGSDPSTRSGNELKVRDFDTPEQMTQQLADNFNSVIPEDGILFHLGDWSFAG